MLRNIKLIFSAITTITVLTLSVALYTNTIIHQQQEAFAQTNDNTFESYENPTYGINIQYPSDWGVDEGNIYADDYVTDIVSFIAPIRSNTEAYAPSLSISIDNLLPNLNEYLTRITTDGLETDSSTTRKGSYEINPPRNQLTGRYYEGLDWRQICNNPLASNYISQPCDSLVTSDGNALTSIGKQVMEDFLCPRGRGVISTIELFVGPIPDRLESELATACGW